MISKDQISSVVRLLQEARRPVFIWGSGCRPYAAQAHLLATQLGIPVACTWGAIDLIHHDDPLMAGGFGTHGTRAANFAVQNADLVISIGSRLDTKSTGQPSQFVRGGKIVMVDIDHMEIDKFDKLDRRINLGIVSDAGEFIEALPNTAHVLSHDRALWLEKIRQWRMRYDAPKVTWPGINPYELMKEIGKYTTKDDILCSDTGNTLGWVMQGFPFKGERMIHCWNMTAMGYGIPSAVGSSFATGKRVVLFSGDGSMMMSLSELSTVKRWNLKIKIILFNNGCHSMCVRTEGQWFGSKNVSTTVESGLGFPDWTKIPSAFGIESYSNLKDLFSSSGPGFLEVKIDMNAHLIPQCRFGYPLEDGEPLLPREELKSQMISPLLEVSNV